MKKFTVRCCPECSTALTETAKPTAIFCSRECKSKSHNRKNLRGHDLYDLFMAQRYDRDAAKAAEVWKQMCRLAEGWKSEDDAAGRRTFEKPAVVLARLMDSGRLMRARPVPRHDRAVRGD